MKVLLVRLSSMGDLIHTLPAIEDLARLRPDVELHWLCEAGFADIARLHPFVKRVHTLRWRQWRKQLGKTATWQAMASLRRDLQHERYDWVLDSQGLIKSAAFAKMAHAPVKGLNSRSAREGRLHGFISNRLRCKRGKMRCYAIVCCLHKHLLMNCPIYCNLVCRCLKVDGWQMWHRFIMWRCMPPAATVNCGGKIIGWI